MTQMQNVLSQQKIINDQRDQIIKQGKQINSHNDYDWETMQTNARDANERWNNRWNKLHHKQKNSMRTICVEREYLIEQYDIISKQREDLYFYTHFSNTFLEHRKHCEKLKNKHEAEITKIYNQHEAVLSEITKIHRQSIKEQNDTCALNNDTYVLNMNMMEDRLDIALEHGQEYERKIAELESVIANWNENNRVLSPVNADHDLPIAL